MKISVIGLEDERFLRPLTLIANLFFEETQVCKAIVPESELTIQFKLTIVEKIFVRAELSDNAGKKLSAEYEKEILSSGSEKEKFKEIKNAVSHVYLTVLQDWTGMIQKWGILTGVRPTKLLHKRVREGVSAETAHQQLKADYLITDEKIDLMQRIVERQLAVVPDLYTLKKEVSIYIGIPFCPTKCAYCTFPAYAINGRQGSVDSFLG
ncbi:MAG: coproporphyrinogen III oxidase, partial [Bacillota bacterium]|nr:coproporphyrinogen III oxidase [Bacillota bacterium]